MATEVPEASHPPADFRQSSLNQVNSKIITLEEAAKIIEETLVLCHGNFNIVHPGHIRYLDFASRQGTRLVVSVLGDSAFLKTKGKHHFREAERAAGIAAMQTVDHVILLGERTLKDAILQLKPDFLVLGKEFEHEQYEQAHDAVELLQSQGGTVLYHAGEFHYASTELLHDSLTDIQEQRYRLFRQTCEQQDFNVEELLELLAKFEDIPLLVIGDTIVDQYVACDALGMSAEAPVIVTRELESRDYVGGAAIVAMHARALGARPRFLSVVGSDHNAILVANELDNGNVEHMLIEDASRPTTLKIRYMVENQKMFRVSRLKGHYIPRKVEEQLIAELRRHASEVRGILVSDFVYGVITPRVLKVIGELAAKHSLLLFGDLQCSSQVGNVAKFQNFHLLCPTEREARVALGAQDEGVEWLANTLIKNTGTRNLIMKLGSEGFIAYEKEADGFIIRQHFPALNPNPVDVTGAGDSLIAAIAVGLCSGVPLMQSCAIGTCMAALVVQTVGNAPVSLNSLQDHLHQIILNTT